MLDSLVGVVERVLLRWMVLGDGRWATECGYGTETEAIRFNHRVQLREVRRASFAEIAGGIMEPGTE